MKYTTRRCNSQFHKGVRVISEENFTSTYHKNLCSKCLSIIRKRERIKNQTRVQTEQAAWREANKAHKADYDRAYRKSKQGKKIRQASDKRNAIKINAHQAWRRQNLPHAKAYYNAASAKRRATLLRAVPKWFVFERQEVKLLYKQASILRRTTGLDYQVDHIVPLQSDIVCGLHTLANLQLLLRKENISKKNKLLI